MVNQSNTYNPHPIPQNILTKEAETQMMNGNHEK